MFPLKRALPIPLRLLKQSPFSSCPNRRFYGSSIRDCPNRFKRHISTQDRTPLETCPKEAPQSCPEEPQQQQNAPSLDLNIRISRRELSHPPFSVPLKTSPPEMTLEERRKAIDAGERAKAAEELWDTFVPDRKMGLQSPMFWILLALCVVLHFINEARDRRAGVSDQDVEEERKRLEAMDKQRKRLEQSEEHDFVAES